MVEAGEQTAMLALMAAKDARVGLGKVIELGIIEAAREGERTGRVPEPEPEGQGKRTVSEAVRVGTASEPSAMGSAREEERTGEGSLFLEAELDISISSSFCFDHHRMPIVSRTAEFLPLLVELTKVYMCITENNRGPTGTR